MNTDRIKKIQQETAYPDSISVQQALLKVWNECEHEKVVNKNDLLPDVSQRSELLLSAICQFTKRNTQKEIQEVEKWIETDFRK